METTQMLKIVKWKLYDLLSQVILAEDDAQVRLNIFV